MIRRQFISESFIYTLTGALPLASGLVLLPFYTNWLTSDQFGLLALYIAITMFMQVIFNFGFDNFAGISYIDNKNNPEARREIMGTIVITLLMTGAVVLVASLLLGYPVFEVFNRTGSEKTRLLFFPYGLMAVATAFFNSMFKTYTSLLIYRQMPGRYMFMNIFNFVLTLVISITWLSLDKFSLNGPMWGRLLSGSGIFFLSLFFFRKEFGLQFSSRHLRSFVRFCGFLVIYQLLSWTLSYIDRFVIGSFLSPTDVAVFDFAFKCLVVIEFLQNGLSSAIIPGVFSHWAGTGDRQESTDVRRYFNGFSAVTVLAVPLYAITLPFLVPLIVKQPVYFDSFKFLPILGLGFMFLCLRQIYSFPLLAKKRSDLLTRAFAWSALTQIVITVIAVKYFGLWGAVWATLLTKPFQVFFMYRQSRRIMPLNLSFQKQVLLPLLVTIAVILAYLLLTPDRYLAIMMVFSIVSVMLTWLFYRKEIPGFFHSFRRALMPGNQLKNNQS